MLFLPELLNHYCLFLNLSGLNDKKNIEFQKIKSEILIRSSSSFLNLIKINQTNNQCLKEFELFEDQLNIQDSKIVFSSVSLGFLLNEISPLLSSLRLLQNLMLKVISIMENISLPSSIADFIKKQDKYKVSAETKEIINKYWESTGKSLRDYRDFDQHFDAITSNYFIQIKPIRTILIQFPDNPEIKSKNKFTYFKNINGIDFLKNSFNEIHETFESLAKKYGATPKKHDIRISLEQMGDLRPAKERILAFSFLETSSINEKNNIQIKIEGLGTNQQKDYKLSFKQYFLDEKGIEKANKIYGVTQDNDKK